MWGVGVHADGCGGAFRTNLPSGTNKSTTQASAEGASSMDDGLNRIVHRP